MGALIFPWSEASPILPCESEAGFQFPWGHKLYGDEPLRPSREAFIYECRKCGQICERCIPKHRYHQLTFQLSIHPNSRLIRGGCPQCDGDVDPTTNEPNQKICTFVDRNTSVLALWYRCITCQKDFNDVTCEPCYRICHKHHETIIVGIGPGYCDCPNSYNCCFKKNKENKENEDDSN